MRLELYGTVYHCQRSISQQDSNLHTGNTRPQFQTMFSPANRPSFGSNSEHYVRAYNSGILALRYELATAMLTDFGILDH